MHTPPAHICVDKTMWECRVSCKSNQIFSKPPSVKFYDSLSNSMWFRHFRSGKNHLFSIHFVESWTNSFHAKSLDIFMNATKYSTNALSTVNIRFDKSRRKINEFHVRCGNEKFFKKKIHDACLSNSSRLFELNAEVCQTNERTPN